jgi:nucleoid-associated protein YgaU
MITPGSRYVNAVVIQVDTGSKLLWAVYPTAKITRKVLAFRYQTAIQGDRFDTLAYREYGDPLLWWVLAQANPEIFYPDEIPVGTVIRIPSAASIL